MVRITYRGFSISREGDEWVVSKDGHGKLHRAASEDAAYSWVDKAVKHERGDKP